MSTIEQQPSCEDPFDHLMPVDEARRRLLDKLRPERITGVDRVPLGEAAGRVLASPVDAPFNVPIEANAAMDGYALAASDIPDDGTACLPVVGTSWAGRPHSQPLPAGSAVRIFTGAVMPDAADTVVIQEHVQADTQTVTIDHRVVPGRNVRAAGEDVAIGDRVFDAGRCLAAADIGVLASLGFAAVPVRRRLRVAWFTTGDELVSLDQAAQAFAEQAASARAMPVDEPLSIGVPGSGLLYDSNRHTLGALLGACNVECIDLGVVADTLEATRGAFEDAAARADLIISSGGVSTGDADFVRQVFHELGDVAFWRLAMRPGRPLAFGYVGEAAFFGLPGNPVAVMVTFLQFVLPALRRLSGERLPGDAGSTSKDFMRTLEIPAISVSKLRKSPGRTEFQRGVMSVDDSGRVVVASTGMQGAGRLSSMAAANCLIVIAADVETVQPGDTVHVQPLHGLLP